ncbi:MAG TPA: helix-turn-helix transcriptional regulator, partial [Ktedonobacteraceae bacterium]
MQRDFQQHLKRERQMRGWSQARIAEEMGTTPNTISAWERGVSLPSPYFRAKLCELLGKSAIDLGLLDEEEYLTEPMSGRQQNEYLTEAMVWHQQNEHLTEP